MVDWLMVLLRIVHIFAGVFWVGGQFFMLSILSPTVTAAGQDGVKFMQTLAQRGQVTVYMSVAGLLTTLAGLTLYGIRSQGFNPDFASTNYGLSLTIGGLFGILGLISGIYFQGVGSTRMKRIIDQVRAQGGPPTPEQMTQINANRSRLSTGLVIGVVLLSLSLIGMSIAQYI